MTEFGRNIWPQQVSCSWKGCTNCITPPPPKPTPSTRKHSWTADCFAVWPVSMETRLLCVQAAAEAVTSPFGFSHQCHLQRSSNRRRPLRTRLHTCTHIPEKGLCCTATICADHILELKTIVAVHFEHLRINNCWVMYFKEVEFV